MWRSSAPVVCNQTPSSPFPTRRGAIVDANACWRTFSGYYTTPFESCNDVLMTRHFFNSQHVCRLSPRRSKLIRPFSSPDDKVAVAIIKRIPTCGASIFQIECDRCSLWQKQSLYFRSVVCRSVSLDTRM